MNGDKLINATEFLWNMSELYKKAGWDPKEVHFSLLDLMKNVNNEPKYVVTATNVDWIPFSERQPDTGGHILITVLWEKGVDTAFDDDYEVMEEDWGVGEAEIAKGTATQMVQRIHERAIAWMPMPEPYKEEFE